MRFCRAQTGSRVAGLCLADAILLTFFLTTHPRAPQDVDCFADVHLRDVFGFPNRLYEESPDLSTLGQLRITRPSQLEPDTAGSGWPVLGPFTRRSEALGAEWGWLRRFTI